MGDLVSWLEALGLSQYTEVFNDNDIDLEILPDLTEQDLRELGVSMGHRKRLLKAIAELRHATRKTAPKPQSDDSQSAHGQGERRQLTVMFCDLVGSTALSVRMDPEDLREVIRLYQDVAGRIITQFEGHITRYMGDGILAFFGYPRAHEDDAERSVRAALEIIREISNLRVPNNEQLQVRIGIGTGQVVVGDVIGTGASQEEAVVGTTPNLAARLQSLAQPNSVVIGETTRNLLGQLFEFADLGEHQLKGFGDPVNTWNVLRERTVASRFEATRASSGLTPLMGREAELQLLQRRWAEAIEGDGQVVLLTGEPGIGKSRLALGLFEAVADQSLTLMRYSCAPYYKNTSLYPVLSYLQRTAGFQHDDSTTARLEKLEKLLARGTTDVAKAAPLIAELLSLPTENRYRSEAMSPQRFKELTLQTLEEQLVGLTSRKPVLVIFEDLHWADPTTLELLERVATIARKLPTLLLLTARPEFDVAWTRQPEVTHLTLNRLGQKVGSQLINEITRGKPLPGGVATQILLKTDGVPLFVEELTKAVVESGLLRDTGERYELEGDLPNLSIPSTLQDSLMARLDSATPVKEVAQIGAAIGREFSYELLSALTDLDEHKLKGVLSKLVQSELVLSSGLPPDAIYTFKHALVQDAAYSSLLRKRRQSLHARIADVISEKFPLTAKTAPELLAHHFSAAGKAGEAIAYAILAGRRAMGQSAYLEAVNHFEHALDLLPEINDTGQRNENDLDIRASLGVCLIATNGYAAESIESNYSRAYDVCREVGDTPRQIPALYGLWVYHLLRGNRTESWDLASQLHQFAEQPDAPVVTRSALAITTLYGGDCREACDLLELAMNSYRLEDHHMLAATFGDDAGLLPHLYHYWSLWMVGKPNQAQSCQASITQLAEQLGTPYVIATAMLFEMLLYHELRDTTRVEEAAKRFMDHSTEQGYPFFQALAAVGIGWAQVQMGNGDEGIEQIKTGIAEFRATGARLPVSYYLHFLADACLASGRVDEGLQAVGEARELMENLLDIFYEPELERQRGELLLMAGAGADEAEQCFRSALELARYKHCKAIELRAAASLCRLHLSQGKVSTSLPLLRDAYACFDEGLETADLLEAQQLILECETAPGRREA